MMEIQYLIVYPTHVFTVSKVCVPGVQASIVHMEAGVMVSSFHVSLKLVS